MEGKVVESMFRMLLMGMSIEQLADGGNCHSNSRIISVKAHKESTPKGRGFDLPPGRGLHSVCI